MRGVSDAAAQLVAEIRELKTALSALRAHVKDLETKAEERGTKIQHALKQVRDESFTFFGQAACSVAVYADHPQIDATGAVTHTAPQVGVISKDAWVRLSLPVFRSMQHDDDSNSTKIVPWYRMLVMNERDCNDIKVFWVCDVNAAGEKSFARFTSYAV